MKIASLSLLFAVAGLLNIGCTASASIHKTSATHVSSAVQAAYTTPLEKTTAK